MTPPEVVQNEPERELSGYRLHRRLLVLGWTERELARRLGRSQTDMRRILAGARSLSESESAWIVKLSDFMRDNPPPRRRSLLYIPRKSPR